MYAFAIAMLLGVAAFALAMFVDRFLSVAREYWALVLAGLGVVFAWLVDFDLFEQWGIGERWDWVGITLTGLMVGGIGLVVHGLANLAHAMARKVDDEAETLEKERNLKRVA